MFSPISIAESYGDCLPVTAILSEIETAASPKLVEAANGKLYVGKANGLSNEGTVLPYVAQEALCAKLGDLAGLMMPAHEILCMNSEIWFGSEYAANAVNRFSAGLLNRVVNPEAIYSVAAFDMWIHNADRNPGNLIGIPKADGVWLEAIDHSHCPMHPPMTVQNLRDEEELQPFKCIHACYRDLLTDRSALIGAIREVQAISDNDITAAFNGYPSRFWSPDDCAAIQIFLTKRRDRLADLMNQASEVVPALQGERI